MTDLVITHGTVVDGTGTPPRVADITIDNGLIVDVCDAGRSSTAHARRVVAAHGQIVTPGFVDVHTHYDAQVS